MTNLVEVTIPTPSSVATTRAQQALSAARALTITTLDQYDSAASALKGIKASWTDVEKDRKVLLQPVDEARARLQAFFKPPLEFLEQAEVIVKAKMVGYTQEQERKRQEEQRRQEELARQERARLQAIADEARAKAAAEQRRLQEIADAAAQAAAAEQARLKKIADDAKAAGDAEAARKAQEEAAAKRLKDEAEQRERERQAAAVAATAAAKADKFEERAATTVAQVVAPAMGKTAGVSMRDNWTFEIKDPKKINPEFMMPDEIKIGRLVKSLQADAAALLGDGVRVYSERVLASRRA